MGVSELHPEGEASARWVALTAAKAPCSSVPVPAVAKVGSQVRKPNGQNRIAEATSGFGEAAVFPYGPWGQTYEPLAGQDFESVA